LITSRRGGAGSPPVTLINQYIQTGDVQDIWWNVQNLGTLACSVTPPS
jgi:hypothetical protein